MDDKQPIDPYWWCRDDIRLDREIWEKVGLPYVRAAFAQFDDPEFWKPKKKQEGEQ